MCRSFLGFVTVVVLCIVGCADLKGTAIDTLGIRVGDDVRTQAIRDDAEVGLYFYTNRVNYNICDLSIDSLASALSASGIKLDYRKYIAGADESMLSFYQANSPNARIVVDEISAYRTAITNWKEPFWLLVSKDKKVLAVRDAKLAYSAIELRNLVLTHLASTVPTLSSDTAFATIDITGYTAGAYYRRQFLSCDGSRLTVILNKIGVAIVHDMILNTTRFVRIDTSIHSYTFNILHSVQLGCSDTIMLVCNTSENYRKVAFFNVRTLKVDTLGYSDRVTVFDSVNLSTHMIYVPSTSLLVTNVTRLDTSIVLSTASPTIISLPTSNGTANQSSLGASGGYKQYRWSALPSSAFHPPNHGADSLVEWMSNSKEIRVLATKPELRVVRTIPLPELGVGYRQYEEHFPLGGSREEIQNAYSKRSLVDDVFYASDTLGVLWMNVTYGEESADQSPFSTRYGLQYFDLKGNQPKGLVAKQFKQGQSITLLVNRPGYLMSTVERDSLQVYKSGISSLP